MFCTKCGNRIEEGNRFCSNCGNEVLPATGVGKKGIVKKATYRQPTGKYGANGPAMPAINTGDIAATLKRFKWPLLGAIAALIIIIVAVKLFEPKPAKDAQTILKARCDCYTNCSEGIEKDLKDLSANFTPANYKTRATALDAVNNLKQPYYKKLSACIQATEAQRLKLRERYLKEYTKLMVFDTSINYNLSNCAQQAASPTEEALYARINQITDPQPDAEKIKNDLLGRKIPGWNFDYLSEFGQFEIVNTTVSDKRVEYQLKMSLRGASDAVPHDCEAMVVYLQSNGTWYLNDLREIYITYTITVPLNQWQRVNPLPNMRYTILDQGKKYWAFDGGWVQKKYMAGPDQPALSLTTNEVYFMSREDSPVDLIFKYAPNN